MIRFNLCCVMSEHTFFYESRDCEDVSVHKQTVKLIDLHRGGE